MIVGGCRWSGGGDGASPVAQRVRDSLVEDVPFPSIRLQPTVLSADDPLRDLALSAALQSIADSGADVTPSRLADVQENLDELVGAEGGALPSTFASIIALQAVTPDDRPKLQLPPDLLAQFSSASANYDVPTLLYLAAIAALAGDGVPANVEPDRPAEILAEACGAADPTPPGWIAATADLANYATLLQLRTTTGASCPVSDGVRAGLQAGVAQADSTIAGDSAIDLVRAVVTLGRATDTPTPGADRFAAAAAAESALNAAISTLDARSVQYLVELLLVSDIRIPKATIDLLAARRDGLDDVVVSSAQELYAAIEILAAIDGDSVREEYRASINLDQANDVDRLFLSIAVGKAPSRTIVERALASAEEPLTLAEIVYVAAERDEGVCAASTELFAEEAHETVVRVVTSESRNPFELPGASAAIALARLCGVGWDDLEQLAVSVGGTSRALAADALSQGGDVPSRLTYAAVRASCLVDRSTVDELNLDRVTPLTDLRFETIESMLDVLSEVRMAQIAERKSCNTGST